MPVITLDARGRVIRVALNNRSAGPLNLSAAARGGRVAAGLLLVYVQVAHEASQAGETSDTVVSALLHDVGNSPQAR